ncbi:hypothetical protein [Pseudonocardia sp. TRM90224]|uniref:hypothetical protein n=1 Tax=Pseudonocardia sp. TRM90224 TaxID=2812678 RepID=UPI001E4E0FF4|nr:hypothetical protein [Pseudonocardia sp. TRM90224]
MMSFRNATAAALAAAAVAAMTTGVAAAAEGGVDAQGYLGTKGPYATERECVSTRAEYSRYYYARPCFYQVMTPDGWYFRYYDKE